jgi:hypothetical protein
VPVSQPSPRRLALLQVLRTPLCPAVKKSLQELLSVLEKQLVTETDDRRKKKKKHGAGSGDASAGAEALNTNFRKFATSKRRKQGDWEIALTEERQDEAEAGQHPNLDATPPELTSCASKFSVH